MPAMLSCRFALTWDSLSLSDAAAKHTKADSLHPRPRHLRFPQNPALTVEKAQRPLPASLWPKLTAATLLAHCFRGIYFSPSSRRPIRVKTTSTRMPSCDGQRCSKGQRSKAVDSEGGRTSSWTDAMGGGWEDCLPCSTAWCERSRTSRRRRSGIQMMVMMSGRMSRRTQVSPKPRDV